MEHVANVSSTLLNSWSRLPTRASPERRLPIPFGSSGRDATPRRARRSSRSEEPLLALGVEEVDLVGGNRELDVLPGPQTRVRLAQGHDLGAVDARVDELLVAEVFDHVDGGRNLDCAGSVVMGKLHVLGTEAHHDARAGWAVGDRLHAAGVEPELPVSEHHGRAVRPDG